LKAEFKGQGLFSAVSGQLGNSSSAAPYQQGNMLFNDEFWIGMSGGFGSFKIGTPDSVMHTQNGRAQPFGTNMGSAWASSGVSRFGAGANATIGVNQFVGGASANGRLVRAEKSVRYDSPNINGFALQVNYAAKNDNQTDATKTTSNTNGIVEYALSYANGPLNVAYAQSTVSAGAYVASTNNTTPGTLATAGQMNANSQAVYTFLTANYTFGGTTVYFGSTTAKTDGYTGTALDTSSYNVAVKYALSPSIDLLANVTSIDDKGTGNKDQFNNAVGVNYKFSKRTTAYFITENYNTNTSGTNTGVNAYAVGILHTF